MENLVKFLLEINKLKTTKRTGWIVEGVESPESVADHSFGMTMLAYLLGSKRGDLDINKAMKMALIHDIGESQTGDLLEDWKLKVHKGRTDMLGKEHGLTNDEKHEIEKKEFGKLTKLVDLGGEEIFDLFMEFEKQETREAVFVRSLDKLEMLIQAIVYEKDQDVEITWFTSDERNSPKDPEVLKLFNYLKTMKK